MKRSFILFVSLLTCHAQQIQIGPGGVITGLLKGDNGAAIVGGHVSLRLLPPYPAVHLRANDWLAITGGGGFFRFDVPYYGRYRLCTQVPNSAWLNPCEWGLQPPIASVSRAQKSVTITMIMKKGVAVPVRVDDPLQVLAQNEGKTLGARLLLGVSSDAFVFHPAPVTSKDSNGRNHQIVIPFDASVNLTVTSAFFSITDAAGQPVGRTGTATIPVHVPAGQQPAAIRLVIAGRER